MHTPVLGHRSVRVATRRRGQAPGPARDPRSLQLPMADSSLRPATPADAAALAALGQQTFTQTFGHTYRPEDLAAFLAGAYSVAWHEALLADPARITWLAEAGSEIIGFGIAGACNLPVPNLEPKAGEIQRLYLRADWQGRGIGSRLLEHLLAELQQRGHAPLYVGVWSRNHRAQRLYARYAFKKVGDYLFPVGEHQDHEFILRRSQAGGFEGERNDTGPVPLPAPGP